MDKNLKTGIKTRSQLQNKYLNTTFDKCLGYKRQWNLCGKHLRIQKRTFYKNQNTTFIAGNRTFWHTDKLETLNILH